MAPSFIITHNPFTAPHEYIVDMRANSSRLHACILCKQRAVIYYAYPRTRIQHYTYTRSKYIFNSNFILLTQVCECMQLNPFPPNHVWCIKKKKLYSTEHHRLYLLVCVCVFFFRKTFSPTTYTHAFACFCFERRTLFTLVTGKRVKSTSVFTWSTTVWGGDDDGDYVDDDYDGFCCRRLFMVFNYWSATEGPHSGDSCFLINCNGSSLVNRHNRL